MSRHIETKKGLTTLLQRLEKAEGDQTKGYWVACVKGCLDEHLAMDETDYELSPKWFRELWKGLK